MFLKAGDVLKGQLAGHRGDGEADAAAAAAVCARLKQLAAAGSAPARPAAPAPAVAAPAVTQKMFRIEFSCAGVNAHVMDNLLADLAQRGALENLTPPAQGKGKKKGKKAVQQCVLRLITNASEEDLWEALAFVVDPANLKIEAEAPPPGDPPQDSGYGLFQEAESTQSPSPGRRATDNPGVAVARAGRRDDDKLAVSAAGEASSIRVRQIHRPVCVFQHQVAQPRRGLFHAQRAPA